MSEATHYWPTEPGTYTLEHHSGAVWRDATWNGRTWSNPHHSVDHLEVLAWGYLGVRREAEKPSNDFHGGPCKPMQSEVEPDNAATAQQALDEWRAVKQQPKAADWAYKWAVTLCEIAGAK